MERTRHRLSLWQRTVVGAGYAVLGVSASFGAVQDLHRAAVAHNALFGAERSPAAERLTATAHDNELRALVDTGVAIGAFAAGAYLLSDAGKRITGAYSTFMRTTENYTWAGAEATPPAIAVPAAQASAAATLPNPTFRPKHGTN